MFNTLVAVEFAWSFVCISTVPVSFILLLILSLGVNIIMILLVLLPLILMNDTISIITIKFINIISQCCIDAFCLKHFH